MPAQQERLILVLGGACDGCACSLAHEHSARVDYNPGVSIRRFSPLLLVAALLACDPGPAIPDVVPTDTPAAPGSAPTVAATPSPASPRHHPPHQPHSPSHWLRRPRRCPNQPRRRRYRLAPGPGGAHGRPRVPLLAVRLRRLPLPAVRRAADRREHGRHHLRPISGTWFDSTFQTDIEHIRRALRGPRQRPLRHGCLDEAAGSPPTC